MAFPKWIQALETAPRGSAIGGVIGVSIVASGFLWSILMANGHKPKTMSNDWSQANKEYMKFQKMNPIFGITAK
jgi:hypothetical protein